MRQFVVLLAMFVITKSALAGEPRPEVLPPPRVLGEVLPPPLPIVEMGPLGPVRPGYLLPDRYAHWGMMALDQQGQLKPRVVLAPRPFPPYYLYDGMPYRFMPTRPLDVSPYVIPR